MSSPTFDAPAPDELGRLMPAYEFQHLIAKGGMGAVYKARQRSLDRDVAIKILPREVGNDPQFRESFEIEARAMAKLNHPNLIGVYDYGKAGDMLYIVMEYVPGKSLYHSAYGKQVDPIQAVDLVQGICAGLGHAHENGIIHRDIKPANVLLTPEAQPKIGDFGLARPVESDGVGLVMGTPGYTAPEILTSPHVADGRSDLFAVGVILYELLTGIRQPPDPPLPSTLCVCGPAMDAIWQRATDPDPDHRYPDAESLSKALAEWSVKAKIAAANRLGVTHPRVQPSPLHHHAAGPALAPQHPPRSSAGPIRVLILIAAVIITTIVIWQRRQASIRQQENIMQQEAAERAAQDKKPLTQAPKPKPVPIPTPGPKIDPPKEDPMASLERLRFDLADGKRSEMPVGTQRHGDCSYFHVNRPMSWAEAACYAERCGGHLAIPTSDEDLIWIGKLSPPQGCLWIGAGSNGASSWSMQDGSRWQIPTQPRGDGPYLAVDPLGLVKCLGAGERHTFLIQWHPDGSNPATLASVLDATANSVTSGAPVYPPGTVASAGRHFLCILRPASWSDAATMAERSGGHLATAASATECSILADLTDGEAAPDGIWLGGCLKGDEWTWATGEPWKTAKWIEDADHSLKNSALIIRPRKGWDTRTSSKPASGFIIEWSDEAPKPDPAVTRSNTNEPSDGDIPDLKTRAKELLQAADRKRTEQLITNSRSFTWDLDNYLRTLARNDQTVMQPHVAVLRSSVRDNRVPTAVTKDSGVLMTPQTIKIAADCAARQTRIDETFLAEADKLRLAYLGKLKEAIAAAEQAGQPKLAAALRASGEDAAANETWIRSLKLDPKPDSPVLNKAFLNAGNEGDKKAGKD